MRGLVRQLNTCLIHPNASGFLPCAKTEVLPTFSRRENLNVHALTKLFLQSPLVAEHKLVEPVQWYKKNRVHEATQSNTYIRQKRQT